MDHCQIVEDMEMEVDEVIDLDFCKVERGFQCQSWVGLLKERERKLKEEEREREFRVEGRFVGRFVAPNW